MQKAICCFLLLPFFCQCVTQHDTTNATQMGYGAKIRLDLSGERNTNYQISLTAGASQSLIDNYCMLFYQPSLILYQGGLGNKSTFKDINKFRFEIVNSFGVNLGYGHLDAKNTEGANGFMRYMPFSRSLITWSPSNATALNNPYPYGLTLASNFIWSNAKNADKSRQVQRTGFVGVALPYVTFGYSNDGPPFGGGMSIGDAYDRYWTGRGFALFEADLRGTKAEDRNLSKWQLLFQYDRFTGFSRDNYEISNVLGLRFIPYGAESAWNKGVWTISAINKNYNIGILMAFYNHNSSDIQNLIHWNQRYPFHSNIYDFKRSIGLTYELQNGFK
jgi:hypothetical protein